MWTIHNISSKHTVLFSFRTKKQHTIDFIYPANVKATVKVNAHAHNSLSRSTQSAQSVAKTEKRRCEFATRKRPDPSASAVWRLKTAARRQRRPDNIPYLDDGRAMEECRISSWTFTVAQCVNRDRTGVFSFVRNAATPRQWRSQGVREGESIVRATKVEILSKVGRLKLTRARFPKFKFVFFFVMQWGGGILLRPSPCKSATVHNCPWNLFSNIRWSFYCSAFLRISLNRENLMVELCPFLRKGFFFGNSKILYRLCWKDVNVRVVSEVYWNQNAFIVIIIMLRYVI